MPRLMGLLGLRSSVGLHHFTQTCVARSARWFSSNALASPRVGVHARRSASCSLGAGRRAPSNFCLGRKSQGTLSDGIRLGGPFRVRDPQRRSYIVTAYTKDAPEPEIEYVKTFEETGLTQELLDAVKALGLTTPTEIQARGIPEVLQGGSLLLASQTGSGKTLSYLLPMIQRLREEEVKGYATTRAKHPRALVLLPTRELSHQVLAVSKSICHHARLRCTVITGGDKYGLQKKALEAPQDLLICTPGRLLKHAEDGNVFLGDVRCLVLDEADTMFDAGFGEDIKKLLRPMKNKTSRSVIMVAATMSKPVRKLIAEELPDMRDVAASSLHRAASNCRHEFLRVPGTENKLEYLRQVIDKDVRNGKRTMVFCNTIDSCRAVEHSLAENGIPTVCYHGDMLKEQRTESFATFLSDPPPGQKRALLVCTDLAARGLDVGGTGGVDHVVQFDFPRNPVDYMHRSGRTARAGAPGMVTNLVGKRDETLAHQIHKQVMEGGSLDGVARSKRELIARKELAVKIDRKERAKTEYQQARRLAKRGIVTGGFIAPGAKKKVPFAKFSKSNGPADAAAGAKSPYSGGPKAGGHTAGAYGGAKAGGPRDGRAKAGPKAPWGAKSAGGAAGKWVSAAGKTAPGAVKKKVLDTTRQKRGR